MCGSNARQIIGLNLQQIYLASLKKKKEEAKTEKDLP